MSMAKMSGKLSNKVDDLQIGQRRQDKKLDAIMDMLQELRPHKQDQDPTKKHPRSEFPSPQLAITDHQSYASKASSHLPKSSSPPSHHRFNQTEYFKIPHLLLPKFLLSTQPQSNKLSNPQTFYIVLLENYNKLFN